MKKENQFSKIVSSLKEALEKIEEKNISFKGKTDFTDFKSTKAKYIFDSYKQNLSRLQNLINNPSIPSRVNELLRLLSLSDVQNNKKVVDELIKFEDVKIIPQKTTIKIGKIPAEVRNEVKVDLDEVEKCFNHACYRSCVILCGRILETALHRKYYDTTQQDILEKNPGIGLGNLIAKLKDKGVNMDPALTNQIHLINQTRIFSVHKKKESFNPSEQQTQAMILYTLDILEKLF